MNLELSTNNSLKKKKEFHDTCIIGDKEGMKRLMENGRNPGGGEGGVPLRKVMCSLLMRKVRV